MLMTTCEIRENILVKEISCFTHSKDKRKWRCIPWIKSCKHLAIEWCKSSSSTDKTLWYLSITKSKMPERDHPWKNRSHLCITEDRTPPPFTHSLDHESKTLLRKTRDRIRPIDSRKKLEEDILTRLDLLLRRKNSTICSIWIGELKYIVCEWYLVSEDKCRLDHRKYIRKNSRDYGEFLIFCKESYAALSNLVLFDASDFQEIFISTQSTDFIIPVASSFTQKIYSSVREVFIEGWAPINAQIYSAMAWAMGVGGNLSV